MSKIKRRIRQATTSEDFEVIRKLFCEYAAELDFDLCFQNFDSELDNLPNHYLAAGGVVLLSEVDAMPVGCVGMRVVGPKTCEMKRLFVKPVYRRAGIGRALAIAIIDEARSRGFQTMLLDTLPQMREAIALYRALGFRDVQPYYHNPICGAIFMELSLQADAL